MVVYVNSTEKITELSKIHTSNVEKAFYRNNKPLNAENHKRWSANNKEHLKEYRLKNKERIKEQYKNHMNKKQIATIDDK